MDYVIVIHGGTGTIDYGWTDERVHLQRVEDIARLGALNGVLRGTEKDLDREEMIPNLHALLFAAADDERATNLAQNIRGTAMNALNLYSTFRENRDLLQKFEAQGSRERNLRSFMEDQANRVELVFDLWCKHLLTASRETFDRAKAICEKGTSEWMWGNLTKRTWPSRAFLGGSLIDHIFPPKLESGITLTVRELRTDTVVSAHACVLTNSHQILSIVNGEDYFESFHNITKSDTTAQAAKEKASDLVWTLIPIEAQSIVMQTREYTPKGRSKLTEVVVKINEFLINAYMGLVPMGVSLEKYWNLFEIKIDDSLGIDIREQARLAIEKKAVKPWMPEILDLLDLMELLRPAPKPVVEYIACQDDIVPGTWIMAAVKRLDTFFPDPRTGKEKDQVISWVKKQPQLATLLPLTKQRRQGTIGGVLVPDVEFLLSEIAKDRDHVLFKRIAIIRGVLLSFSDAKYQQEAVNRIRNAIQVMKLGQDLDEMLESE